MSTSREQAMEIIESKARKAREAVSAKKERVCLSAETKRFVYRPKQRNASAFLMFRLIPKSKVKWEELKPLIAV